MQNSLILAGTGCSWLNWYEVVYVNMNNHKSTINMMFHMLFCSFWWVSLEVLQYMPVVACFDGVFRIWCTALASWRTVNTCTRTLGSLRNRHGWDLVVDLRSLWEFTSTTGVSLSFSLRRFALTGSLFRPLIGSGHLHQGQVSDAFHRTWTSQDRRHAL